MSGEAERVYIGLGGNIGDPASAMAAALRKLDDDSETSVVAVSALYRTAAWGRTDQPDFLNAVAELMTRREPRDLLGLCLDIERNLKRERRERWGPRTIDIDILLFGTRTIREDGLEVPHPRMSERAFVLAPLAELAPELPIDGTPVMDRLALLGPQRVERLPTMADWWRQAEPRERAGSI